MHLLWIVLGLSVPGANSFMIYNTKEGLCLEDPPDGTGVLLNQCQLSSASQDWAWDEGRFLANTGTLRCLSALHVGPMRTAHCDGADHLGWQCTRYQLVSLNRSLQLSADGRMPTLSKDDKTNKWKSLTDADMCKEKLRSRRQSDPVESELSHTEEVHTGRTMADEQDFLRWFYRTEDSTSWTFAMLVLCFIALLLGCVLVVISMMGNRNRKKIYKYRTAAATASMVKPECEELQVIIKAKEATNSHPAQMQHSDPHNNIPVGGAGETEALKPGDIIVTWKDGSVSNLYPSSPEEDGDK